MYRAIAQWGRGMARPRMGRRIGALWLSIVLMGLCVAVFERIGFGTDPCATMSLGISRHVGLAFGTTQLLFNLVMIVLVLLLDARRIGLGTLANMVFVGYVAQFGMAVLDRIPAANTLTLAGRFALFVPAMAVFMIAAPVYMAVDLGVAPYDAVPQIIARRMSWSFRAVRVCWDIAMMTGGFLLGSTVGIVTMVVAFGMGPAVTYIARKTAPLFQ